MKEDAAAAAAVDVDVDDDGNLLGLFGLAN